MPPRFALWDVVVVTGPRSAIRGLEGTVTSPPARVGADVVYRVFFAAIEEGRTLAEGALAWTGRVDDEARALHAALHDEAARGAAARRRRARTIERRRRTPARRR